MSKNRPSVADKRRSFQQLHAQGCFVIPNPWDAGSAVFLQSLGFKALATTSAGFAWSQAKPDNGITRDAVLAHLHQMVAATDLPLNADFESGYSSDAAGVARSVALAIEAGVAGLSIEDATGQADQPLFSQDMAVQRLQAARRAIDRAGGDVLLVGRAECYLVGQPDLAETISRLKAYADAGADCLYAPGLSSPEDIAAVVAAVAPKPVNLLVGSTSAYTVQQYAGLGVRRISVGGALARAAWGGFVAAAQQLADHGSFDGLGAAAPGQLMNGLFGADSSAR